MTLKKSIARQYIRTRKYSVCRHSSSSNLYHRSIYHFSPLLKLLAASSTERRTKESRERVTYI